MTNSELNQCYRACKDLLFQLGLVPADKTLKEMMSCIDIPEPDVLMVHDAAAEAPWMQSFQNLNNALKYKDSSHKEETNFYKAAQEIDRMNSKTSHGYLSAGPNMFARALNMYVCNKLEKEGKKYRYTEFETCNQIWYTGYYKTHQDTDEIARFSDLFDKLITDLKEKGIISELTIPKKTNMKEVKEIVSERRKSKTSSPKVAQANRVMNVRGGLQQ